MHFGYSEDILRDYSELVSGVLVTDRITHHVSVGPRTTPYNAIAAERLAEISEGELPEVQAWRRVFSRMGLKSTQYRSASESLLRRFRKEESLPQIHPLIDICNAISLAFAIPIAVFDVGKIEGFLEVRYALGTEAYLAFSNEVETPNAHEVIFADEVGRAHARRWTNRQSAYSAIRDDTAAVLVVAEAVHASAREDIQRLVAAIAEELTVTWSVTPETTIMDPSSPRFEF